MRKFEQPLGDRQAQILRHWVSLDAVGLHPDSKYFVARFGISKGRILSILSRLRDTGYISVYGSKRKTGFVKSRRLTLTRKTRDLFNGGNDD